MRIVSCALAVGASAKHRAIAAAQSAYRRADLHFSILSILASSQEGKLSGGLPNPARKIAASCGCDPVWDASQPEPQATEAETATIERRARYEVGHLAEPALGRHCHPGI